MTVVNKILRTSAIIISTLALTGMAASASANDVTLEVINIENAQGTLRIAIYDTEDSYNTETVYRALAQSAVKGSVEIVLSDLPIGQYGVMLFHDTNDNNELDTNLMGIPNEPWGGSLQGRSVFGRPGWNDISFMLPEAGDRIVIDMQ